ncbi:TPA: hypothetical protein DCZ31_04065, partial [Patescibacteria group bacterium]|nr:hypothetical protein [Candidatus Gracilibacteria bacterium]
MCLNSLSVFKFASACKIISPHLPQFPPYGHHFGIYFSLLHETIPSHHFQAINLTFTSSINI